MTVLQPLVPPKNEPTNDETRMNQHDEYGMLMSLALDGLLDVAERQQLDAHLAGCARCQSQWSLWQSIDATFRAAPMTEPSPAFLPNFSQRLAAQERRRQMRLGILLGALTLVMWIAGVVGVSLMIGAFIYNQVGWFTDSLHWLAYLWTAATVIGGSLLALLGGIVEEPSALGLLAGYIILAGSVLTFWSRYLRRSLQMVDAG